MDWVANYKPITELLLDKERDYGDQVYLRQAFKGEWKEWTWAEVMQQARQCANFLLQIGLKAGDHVAIYSKNCVEWFIADFGISLAGLVNVPLFPNQHPESIEYVLAHAEIKLVLFGKLDQHQRARAAIPAQYKTLNFNYYPALPSDYDWEQILESEPLKAIHRPAPEDLYTIIYSSGTSALPKGAMYSHQRISNYIQTIGEEINMLCPLPKHRLLSYLPLPHVYERATSELLSLSVPSVVSFVESLDSFADNLREVKPTIFAAVPRIWDVFYHKILQKLPKKKLQRLLCIPIVAGIVKRKIKAQLGLQECQVPISGAAHLPLELIAFFDSIGLPIQEGYGQTENLSYGCFSKRNNRKAGYVGGARHRVDLKIGDEAELWLKSPCLMNGYFKDPEATDKAFTRDGWLKTGDLVEMDSAGRVKILGRISENFKNQKGEFICPSPIEKRFLEGSWVEQLCLVGRGLVSNILLLSLSPSAQKLPRETINAYLQERLRATNSQLNSHEKIAHILIVKDSWTTENGLMTPTLKVKRRVVEAQYQSFIHKALEQGTKFVWEQDLEAGQSA